MPNPLHSHSLATLSLRGRCPACGQGKLYKNLLTIADHCNICALPLKAREQGDGPAFLAILLVGALTAISATIIDIKLEPHLWLHLLIWPPFVLIGSLLSLRFLKAWMIAVQYHYRKEDFKN